MNFLQLFKRYKEGLLMLVHAFLMSAIFILSPVLLGSTLTVFYPSTLPASNRQKALTDSKIGFNNVLVFAKFKDFDDYQKRSPADFIIVPPSYVTFNKGYTCTHQFTSNGEKGFKFQLLSADKVWTLNKTDDGVLGVVDELGRREMKEYVDALLAGRKFKQVTRVTNIEDLFGLLALENANYILVSPQHVTELHDRFKLNTSVVTESAPVKHPYFCSKDGSKFDAAKLTPQIIKSLGYAGVTEIK